MRGSAFFDDVRQVEIEIGGTPGRTPTFYHDSGLMTAVFPAAYRGLRDLMPSRDHVPALLAPGLGAIAITCFEHRDTDVGPYNEVAIGIPLNVPRFRANLPGRALLSAARRRRQDVFVVHLPVTTEVALRGGIDFYNFPKFLADIEFTDDGGGWRCRMAHDGEHVLTLTGRRLATAPGDCTDLVCHLWMDGLPQTGRLRMRELAAGHVRATAAATLELGDRHPVARQLEDLLVCRRPIQYDYVPRLEAILFGAERLTLPLVRRGLEAMDATAATREHQPA